MILKINNYYCVPHEMYLNFLLVYLLFGENENVYTNWSPWKLICWKKGESTLCPLKIVVTKIKILHLVFLGTYRHHILDYFCLFQVYYIKFKLKLVNLKINSNKHLQTWTYKIYLCRKNTCHKVCKITNILQN